MIQRKGTSVPVLPGLGSFLCLTLCETSDLYFQNPTVHDNSAAVHFKNRICCAYFLGTLSHAKSNCPELCQIANWVDAIIPLKNDNFVAGSMNLSIL